MTTKISALAREVRKARWTSAERVDLIAQESDRVVWPYRAVLAAREHFDDAAFSANFVHLLSANYSHDAHWPVGVWLLARGWTDASLAVNLLSLVQRVSTATAHWSGKPLVARLVTATIERALSSADDLITFDALNILGGLDGSDLSFRSEVERTKLEEKIQLLTSDIDDEAVSAFLLDRATRAVVSGGVKQNLPTSLDAFCYELANHLQDHLARASDEDVPWQVLSAENAHIIGTIRTALEATSGVQTAPGAVLARASASESESVPISAAAMRVVTHALDLLGSIVESVLFQPRMLSVASVQGVFLAENASDDETPGTASTSVPQAIKILRDRIVDARDLHVQTQLHQVVATLKQHRLTLVLEGYGPDGSVERLAITPALIAGPLSVTAAGADGAIELGKVPSLDVPQADEIERVFRVVELLAAGEELTGASLGNVNKRQVDYYKHAARILGLVTNYYALTPAGERVARLSTRDERLVRSAILFETSVVGRAWIRWKGVDSIMGLNPDHAREFVEQATLVTGDTIGRRATTLRTWVRMFQTVLAP